MDRKSGLAFHVHHDVLLEFCYDYDERVAFIKNNKPEHERELRLRLFQLVSEDRLPKKRLPTYYKVSVAYEKACDSYEKANRKELLELHNELCPNCPWNGKSIFAENDDAN